MALPFPQRTASVEQPLRFSDISPQGQARLMDMSFARIAYGVHISFFIGSMFVLWMLRAGVPAGDMIVWSFGMAGGALVIRWQRRSYAEARRREPDEVVVRRWLPRVLAWATAYGLALCVAFILVHLAQSPYEMRLLFLLTLASMMAANATHQSPVLRSFQCFFLVGWGLVMALIPWVFPDHWTVIMPLSAMYLASLHKHAVIVHRFFLQQIKLEEDSTRLAEQHQAAKHEAEAALRAKNQFLSTASHDLRQPVHAMGFLIEAIASRNRDATLLPSIADLRQSVRSVTRMFNSLLDLSKIESGAVRPKPEHLRIDELLADVATLFRGEAQSRNLALRVRGGGGRAVVHADALLLRQCLSNLTHNALRYTRSGGVLLAVRPRGNSWQMEVWDTGVGVALAEQDQIYSPYYRPRHAWNVDNPGHGLGLAVVARCAEMMGAEYGLTSREGRGSRFWLRLPACLDFEPGYVAPAHGASPSAFQFQHLAGACLVVDDDPEVCAAWQSLLVSWGLSVRCAGASAEAIACLEGGFRPDAIFCDQRLRAGESGFDVLRGLLERCPEAGGAMISGEFESPDLLQAEREGYLVLHKPLEPDALYAVLSWWLPAAPLVDRAQNG